MARFFRVSLLVAVASALVATVAFANIPDPNLSTVPGYITVSDDGSYVVTIQVRGPQGGVDGALVELETSPDADTLVAWANPVPGGADAPSQLLSGGGRIFAKNADATGNVTFRLAGGGCIDKAAYAGNGFICQVRADGVVLGEPGINSFDVVNSNGDLPTDIDQNVCLNGASAVGLADAVFHARNIKSGANAVCSDFTEPYGDGVGLTDGVVIVKEVKKGAGETCQ